MQVREIFCFRSDLKIFDKWSNFHFICFIINLRYHISNALRSPELNVKIATDTSNIHTSPFALTVDNTVEPALPVSSNISSDSSYRSNNESRLLSSSSKASTNSVNNNRNDVDEGKPNEKMTNTSDVNEKILKTKSIKNNGGVNERQKSVNVKTKQLLPDSNANLNKPSSTTMGVESLVKQESNTINEKALTEGDMIGDQVEDEDEEEEEDEVEEDDEDEDEDDNEIEYDDVSVDENNEVEANEPDDDNEVIDDDEPPPPPPPPSLLPDSALENKQKDSEDNIKPNESNQLTS
jgi:hypothetical protein